MTVQSNETRRTAIHEAGHAVAKMRLGLPCGDVSIIPDAGRLGWASGGGDLDLDVASAENEVLSVLAGYAALVSVDEPEPDAGDEGDLEKAQETIDFWCLPGSLEEWKARSVALMRRPENLHAVAVISERLLRDDRLDADLLDVLLEFADGEITLADLERFERAKRA